MWQSVANRPPTRAILIALPKDYPVQKQTVLIVDKLSAAEGHQVRVIAAPEVSATRPSSAHVKRQT